MVLEFEHRPSDSPWIERVWRSRSTDTAVMTSVARIHWDLVFWTSRDGMQAGVQGPESRASLAPVPTDAEFVGIRMALGVTLADLRVPSVVDRFIGLPASERTVRLNDRRFRVPGYDEAEDFIDALINDQVLVTVPSQGDGDVSDRTRQRRFLTAVGLPQRTVRQIERVSEAADRIRRGDPFSTVAAECGYFDQPHLARSLRRFIGRSATELIADAETDDPLSLLYKTTSEARG